MILLPSNFKCLSIFCLLVLAGAVQADPWLEADGDLFRDARLVFEQSKKQEGYKLVLSEIKKINSEWRTEKELDLVGDVERRSYQLRSGMEYRDARPQLLNKLDQLEGQLLFSCEGLDCGSSYGWANEYFQIKELYGLSDYQSYSVWRVNSKSEGSFFAVLYLVQRGNKRVYLQSDLVFPNLKSGPFNVSRQALEQAFQIDGHFTLDKLLVERSGSQMESDFKPVADFLKAKPGLRLWLVGHNFSKVSLEEQKRLGLEQARKVQQVLVKLGVAADRLELQSVGGLAPSIGKSEPKVVLVPR